MEVTSCPEGVDEVICNPEVPVEFQPNFRSFAANEWALSLDQGSITARDEALVYTSAPLTSLLTVWGRPSLTITVLCPTSDADLFVLLSDVFPLGSRDLHLSHTATRLATVPGFTPTKTVVLKLDMDEVAHEFLPGHSVRLTVAPSLFPIYARNLHGQDYVNGTDIVLGALSLYHGGANCSYLRLPVVGPVMADS